MTAEMVTITYLPEWRRDLWDVSVPSRPAWMVDCPDHPHLGKDSDGQPWGYSAEFRARGVATRHLRAYHSRADVISDEINRRPRDRQWPGKTGPKPRWLA